MATTNQPAPLDESLYTLDDQEIQLLSKQTGITDPDELKKHVMEVQAEIYAVWDIVLLIANIDSLYRYLGPSVPLYSWIFFREVRAK